MVAEALEKRFMKEKDVSRRPPVVVAEAGKRGRERKINHRGSSEEREEGAGLVSQHRKGSQSHEQLLSEGGGSVRRRMEWEGEREGLKGGRLSSVVHPNHLKKRWSQGSGLREGSHSQDSHLTDGEFTRVY